MVGRWNRMQRGRRKGKREGRIKVGNMGKNREMV